VKNATGARRRVRTTGTLTAQSTEMTISHDGMGIVMKLLSNLYTNPNEAVLREYACNARDAHIEAGQDRPIEISLPNNLMPNLTVRDYGVGMSFEDIVNVYARYGESTKRDTNSQIGAFGIGAKSAFAVTTSFTVSAVKDGQKTNVLFSLNDQGIPSYQILFEGPTDDPNGVEVTLGVENVNAVVDAAKRLFRYWKPGTVLVDGEQPEHAWANTEALAEGIYANWSHRSQFSAFELVMGGVPYAIPNALWDEVSAEARQFRAVAQATRISFVLDVPIGSVDISPNREDLKITPRTRKTFAKLIEVTANGMNAWITAQLDQSANLWEASRFYEKLVSKLNWTTNPRAIKWKGQSLGSDTALFTLPTFSLAVGRYSYVTGSTSKRTVRSEGISFSIVNPKIDDVLFVTGVPEDKQNTVRLYAKAVLADLGKNRIVVSEAESGSNYWFSYGEGSDTPVDSMSFVNYHALGRGLRKSQGTGSGRSRISYETRYKGDNQWISRSLEEIDDLGADRALYSGPEWDLDLNNPIVANFWKKNDVLLVRLSSRQKVEVLQKNIDGVEHTPTVMRKIAEEVIEKMTQQDHGLMKLNQQTKAVDNSLISFIRSNRNSITNKGLLKEIDDHQSSVKLTSAQTERVAMLSTAYRMALIPNPYQEADNSFNEKIIKRYPLACIVVHNTYAAERVLRPHSLSWKTEVIKNLNA
jgi:hypothetical protein